MTRRVISTSPNATIAAAIRLILKNGISGLPVIDKGKLVGILSEGGLLRRPGIGTERRRLRWLDALFWTSAKAYVRSHGRKIKDVMTRDPVTVKESAALHEVTYLMEYHNIKRLPVVRAGKVVGIISRAKPDTGACNPPPRSNRRPRKPMQRSAIAFSARSAAKTGPIHSISTSSFAMV
jgi:CBS domain-containing protein